MNVRITKHDGSSVVVHNVYEVMAKGEKLIRVSVPVYDHYGAPVVTEINTGHSVGIVDLAMKSPHADVLLA